MATMCKLMEDMRNEAAHEAAHKAERESARKTAKRFLKMGRLSMRKSLMEQDYHLKK